MNNIIVGAIGLVILVAAALLYTGAGQFTAGVTEPTEIPSQAQSQAPALTTNGALSQQITLDAPATQQVGKKFAVSGKAPGPWYFEASFPIFVTDAQDNKIATSYGQAQGDWMTTELVPFTAQIDVGAYTGPATVHLLRDNPSGMPENDDSASFQVMIQ